MDFLKYWLRLNLVICEKYICILIISTKRPKIKYKNKEAIWLYAELFLGHHDGSCHGLW